MLAFLNRRWVLLSCAGVLLGCSMVDARRIADVELGSLNSSTAPMRLTLLDEGIRGGDIRMVRVPDAADDFETKFRFAFHRPMFGTFPKFNRVLLVGPSIPLWLPLSVILGWIVWRELRWREKRAKAAQSVQ